MENNKKKNLWIGALIVLVIIAGLLFWLMKRGAVSNVGQNTDQSTQSTEDTSSGSINAGATTTISYQNALAKYKNAHLEFDKACGAKPNTITLKNNSYLMIDNQSPSDRVVKVGSLMNIGANSFKIINVSNARGTLWNIDCDQNKNVATVNIQ